MNGSFGLSIRPEFCLDPDAVFLNHGSYGATPRAVLHAQSAWRERMEAQPVDFLARRLLDLLDTPIAELAAFLGARPGDLAFVDNATTALNSVASSLGPSLAPGDEIVITRQAHPGCRRPFTHMCEMRGATLVNVDLPYPVHSDAQITTPVLAALGPRTRLAIFDHIVSPTGLQMPLAGERGLVALCRERGIPVLVDGAHAPGHIELDLTALGADYYVGNCHKWLFTPRGCGFLWAREQHQPGLSPAIIADRYARPGREPTDISFADRFHWVGTRDPSSWLCVSAGLAWLGQRGARAVREHNLDLAAMAATLLLARLSANPGVDPAFGADMPMPASMRSAMVTLPLGRGLGQGPAAALRLNHELWQQYRIEVPIVAHADRLWVRISAQVYNTLEQYDRLADALLDVERSRH
jgi:isopenicillin-N epimerase